MGTCPNCRTSSRVSPEGFTAEKVLIAKPIGSVLLGGSSMKTVATERIRLMHTCGWSAIGRLDGGDFVIESQEVVERNDGLGEQT